MYKITFFLMLTNVVLWLLVVIVSPQTCFSLSISHS